MGATDESVVCITLPAGGALTTAAQFCYCEMSTTGQITIANADTDITIGVIYGGLPAAAAGDPVSVAISGKVKVKNGATLANAGILVAPDANGKNQAAVTGDRTAGVLCTAGAALNELTEVILRPTGALIA